jgi:hypothetical protein
MGELQILTPKMLKQKLRVAQAKVLLKQAVIIILSIIIGWTFCYSWIEGKVLFAEHSKTIILIEKAEAKTDWVSRELNQKGNLVSTDASIAPSKVDGDLVSSIRSHGMKVFWRGTWLKFEGMYDSPLFR